MAVTLTGTEILQVLAVQANGQPAATTEQTTTGAIAGLSSSNPKVVTAVAATATAVIGGKYSLNAASGSVLTLPAATGTGGSIRVIVGTTVTSNSHKVLAASSSDSMQGNLITEDAGTCTGWNSAIATGNHSLQLNGTTTGGFQGDSIDLLDAATGVWQVTGTSKSTGTAATPFSTATS